MHLARKLFGEILPFRVDPRRGHVVLKGGLAWGDDFAEAHSVVLRSTDEDHLQAIVSYTNEPPAWLYDPDNGSAVWFDRIDPLQLRVMLPEGFHYDLDVRLMSAPDFFLNEAGRPERHPPDADDPARLSSFVMQVTSNRWWASDEHSAGHEWWFSVNDLPCLPPLGESELCQRNTAPGVYPGTYFTCSLNDHRRGGKEVEYWFSYELESSIDRAHAILGTRPTGVRRQYRFSFGRTDKQELDANEGHRVVDLWEYLLGFCSGAFRTADIIIGYGDHGGWSYAELPQRFAKQVPCKFTWFPQRWPMDFPAFASNFLIHFQEDYDRHSDENGVPAHFLDPGLHKRHGFGAAIPILEGYLRAASLELPHDALNAALATLESEAKQRSGTPDKARLPAGAMGAFLRGHGIPPGKRFHGIGSYENVSWGAAQTITGVKDPPEGATSWVVQPEYGSPRSSNPIDEDYGIDAIKAWRDQRASHFDAHAGGGTFHDIRNYSQLTLEYLELLVLRAIDYSDLYRSRTSMYDEAVKPVPGRQSADGT